MLTGTIVVLGIFWAIAMVVAVFAWGALEANERRELKRNFASVIRGRVFLGYPGIIVETAKQLSDELRGKGYSVFLYDPHSPFPDPVDAVATAIEEAEYAVILQPRETDWLHAEEKYSKILGKPIVKLYPVNDHLVHLSRIRLIISKILRARHQTTHRLTALVEGFGWGRVKSDHDRSVSPRWEKGIDIWEHDEVENARKAAGCLAPFLSFGFMGSVLLGLILWALGNHYFVIATAVFAFVVSITAGIRVLGDAVVGSIFLLSWIVMLLRR